MVRRKKFESTEQLESLINDYFESCDKNKTYVGDKEVSEPYTVSGLCLALNTNRQTLLDYQESEEFGEIVEQAKQRIENWIETRALNNSINSTVAIFNLKNNFGWKDKTETELSSPEDRPFQVEHIKKHSDDELDARITELINKTTET